MIKFIYFTLSIYLSLALMGCDIRHNDVPMTITEEIIQHDFDFQDFLKWTWVIDGGQEYSHFFPSLGVYEINSAGAKARISYSNFAYPPVFQYDENRNYNISFTLNGNTAEGYFDIPAELGDDIIKGKITLSFMGEKTINAVIEYQAPKNRDFLYSDGNYTYRPLNISDVNTNSEYHFIEEKALSFETDLNTWGKVFFVAGYYVHNRTLPAVFITDEKGDILYDFRAPYQNGIEIYNVTVEDLNGDGLLDVTVSLDNMPESLLHWYFYQLETGLFMLERGEMPFATKDDSQNETIASPIVFFTGVDKGLVIGGVVEPHDIFQIYNSETKVITTACKALEFSNDNIDMNDFIWVEFDEIDMDAQPFIGLSCEWNPLPRIPERIGENRIDVDIDGNGVMDSIGWQVEPSEFTEYGELMWLHELVVSVNYNGSTHIIRKNYLNPVGFLGVKTKIGVFDVTGNGNMDLIVYLEDVGSSVAIFEIGESGVTELIDFLIYSGP